MRAIALAALILVASLLPRVAEACSCLAPGDVASSFDESSVVVAAKAISVTNGPMPPGESKTHGAVDEGQRVEWEVAEAWKGPYRVGQRFTTHTIVQCCMCGYSVEANSIHVLYLHAEAPHSVSICSRSSELLKALPEIPELYLLRDRSREKNDQGR
ncbi:MAG: hypothetical protein HOQ32_19515 [Lysobacter sp.]|nr:hypothetical protein [Lysobacter sp.]